jgi:hypothetical protein
MHHKSDYEFSDSVVFQPKPYILLNSENLKTNFTMKGVNCDLQVSFLKKESSSNFLNTVKKNLIPNLNDNQDIKVCLFTDKKPDPASRYNQILSEHKIIHNYEVVSEKPKLISGNIDEKLDYIINSKKKKKVVDKESYLKRKRKIH